MRRLRINHLRHLAKADKEADLPEQSRDQEEQHLKKQPYSFGVMRLERGRTSWAGCAYRILPNGPSQAQSPSAGGAGYLSLSCSLCFVQQSVPYFT